jgi:hypothetical protein
MMGSLGRQDRSQTHLGGNVRSMYHGVSNVVKPFFGRRLVECEVDNPRPLAYIYRVTLGSPPLSMTASARMTRFLARAKWPEAIGENFRSETQFFPLAPILKSSCLLAGLLVRFCDEPS